MKTTPPPMGHLLDLTIADLLRQYPHAATALRSHALGTFLDPETLEVYGPIVRVGTLLRSRGIGADAFCDDVISAGGAPGSGWGAEKSANLNLFALLPCPLKVPLEEAFLRFVASLPDDQRARLTFKIEGNANTQIDYADYADHFESLDDIPDIVITPGFNSFFHPPFVERFIKTGRFRCVNDRTGDPQLQSLGVVDPDGHYTMLAMNLLVLVVNEARLGSREAPTLWSDLLRPEWAGSIAIRGNRDGTFCETLLLALYKEFGSAGLKRLGKNVRYGWHPSQMVKAAVSGGDEAPAVSVMPLFFAKTLQGRGGISVVWPKDGALVSPVTMLVKQEKRDRLHEVVDFLSGPEVARICSGAFFPAVHPELDNGLPERASFKWIGWDYVKNNDLKALIAYTNDTFERAFRGEPA